MPEVMMKKISKRYCKLQYTHNGEQFKLRGRLIHWSILLLPGAWATFGIPLLFSFEFIQWLFFGLIALGMSLWIAFLYSFEIRIDKDQVVIKLFIGIIPFKVIRSATCNLIIDHRDTDHLSIISPRKDYGSVDIKNKLRFSYVAPWDGDKDEFYMEYNNREIDFDTCHKDELWARIIEGLESLEKQKEHLSLWKSSS